MKAAQYIRMSTDRQDLSPLIQMNAIAAYAAANAIEVVASYEDLGRSGVRLANRPGLSRLLRDVTAKPCFSVVLVYDVSRWGRFQDADASAYYDYHCRLHGVSVIYVAETFGDGTSTVAALAKGMRRLMAAEYSRDLAFKTVAGQERVMAMGFQMGYPPPLGYRRESVSADGLRCVLLEPGQRKLAPTDRIRWVLSNDEEVALVRQIFDLYAHSGCTSRGLARRAVTEGWLNDHGRPLSEAMIATLLRSEALIGNFVWGRPTGQSQPRIARVAVSRHIGAVPRIVDDGTWTLVQAKLASTGWLQRSSEDLLRELRVAVQRKPHLTSSDLPAQGCATKATYCSRFGSWQAALEATGTEQTLFLENGAKRAIENRTAGYSYGRALERALVSRRVPARFNGKFSVLQVRNFKIRIRLLWPTVRPGGRHVWHVKWCQRSPPVERVLFVRMEAGAVPMDYFLVAAKEVGACFPRWLPREVPVPLHAYWSPSSQALLDRLAPVGKITSAATEHGNFNARGLARHRHRLELTLKECAVLTGVSAVTVHRWEKGHGQPHPRNLEAIARFNLLGKREAAFRIAALIP